MTVGSKIQPVSTGIPAERYRRLIRKGTHSCWECKRRKTRCTIDRKSSADSPCTECQRRGVPCISQEFPDERHPRPSAPLQPIYDRLDRVERLLELATEQTSARRNEMQQQLLEVNYTSPPLGGEPAMSKSSPKLLTNLHITHQLGTLVQHAQPNLYARFAKIPEQVQRVLPSSQDIHIICQLVSRDSIYFHQMMVLPYRQLTRPSFKRPEHLAKLPPIVSHPVLLAKHMLVLATLLQGLRTNCHGQESRLSVPSELMMKRLFEGASALVSIEDELITSMEELECLVLTAIFQANNGNLKGAWLLFRRIISISQLLNLHRPGQDRIRFLDPNTHAEPRFLWFRIVTMEGFLCLLLGQPESYRGTIMITETMHFVDEDPVQQLERMHCAITSRILSRNQDGRYFHDPAVTKSIDLEIQKAANLVPQQWWLIPDFAKSSDTGQRFWDAIQVTNQLFYHHLIIQLHLPYLLYPSAEIGHGSHDYSKSTCANSSRELLTRFIAFRSLDTAAFNCHAIDFFGVMAALALLLAHVGSRCVYQDNDYLAHQRPCDRALVEKALENMCEAGRTSRDILSEPNENVLKELLDVEDKVYKLRCAGRVVRRNGECMGETEPVLRISLPHFGAIAINSTGVIEWKSRPNSPAAASSPVPWNFPLVQEQNMSHTANVNDTYTDEFLTPTLSPSLWLEVDTNGETIDGLAMIEPPNSNETCSGEECVGFPTARDYEATEGINSATSK
jgi:hypothetical protein